MAATTPILRRRGRSEKDNKKGSDGADHRSNGEDSSVASTTTAALGASNSGASAIASSLSSPALLKVRVRVIVSSSHLEENGTGFLSLDPYRELDYISSSHFWSQDSLDKFAKEWDLSPNELNVMKELGWNRLSDIDHQWNQPFFVVRFLQVTKWNIETAEKGFRDMLAWRKTNKVDGMLESYETPPLLKNHYPGAILKGLDRVGDPIFLNRLGATDLVGFLKEYGHDEMIRFEIQKREAAIGGRWMKEYEEQQGRSVRKILILEDLYGLDRRQVLNRAGLRFFEEVMRLDQDNYPECAKQIVVLRAPRIFQLAWGLVKNFLDPIVRNKLVITTQDDYLQVLEKYLDVSVLPPCVNPDGGSGEAWDDPCFCPNFEGGRIHPK